MGHAVPVVGVRISGSQFLRVLGKPTLRKAHVNYECPKHGSADIRPSGRRVSGMLGK